MPIEFLISMAASIIIGTVKNPQTRDRVKSVLYKVAAVIYAQAEQTGEATVLDAKIDDEIRKLQSQP